MDRVFLGPHRLHNPIDARKRSASGLSGAPRNESTTDRGEHNGIEQRTELQIVRAVDKNRVFSPQCERPASEVMTLGTHSPCSSFLPAARSVRTRSISAKRCWASMS